MKLLTKNDYDIQLKNLFDKENAKIVATSSSSSLLRDKKAYLTGRATIIEIQPLDFFEYLDFKNITVKKKRLCTSRFLFQRLYKNWRVTGKYFISRKTVSYGSRG
jgi:predicted AAA+ superfamily ATPase